MLWQTVKDPIPIPICCLFDKTCHKIMEYVPAKSWKALMDLQSCEGLSHNLFYQLESVIN